MDYLKPLFDSFNRHANREEAVFMKKYMRDQFEFLGIKSAMRKEIGVNFLRENGLPEPQDIEVAIKTLWKKDEREYQYFALSLLEKSMKKCPKHIVHLYEYLIVTKSWWDTVDGIAAVLLGSYFRQFPEQVKAVTEKWMDSGNFWLQRSALLFQLKFKKNTDTDLLFNYILRLADSKEFFIRKAIGWALREYSKTNPVLVTQFVTDHAHQLSGLSTREAMKVINKKRSYS